MSPWVTHAGKGRIRLCIIDHIISALPVHLPVYELCALCKRYAVPALVDGAHAVGAVTLDLASLGATYYTSNLHKWVAGSTLKPPLLSCLGAHGLALVCDLGVYDHECFTVLLCTALVCAFAGLASHLIRGSQYQLVPATPVAHCAMQVAVQPQGDRLPVGCARGAGRPGSAGHIPWLQAGELQGEAGGLYLVTRCCGGCTG